MDVSWYRERRYRHFDYTFKTENLEKLLTSSGVAKHSFKPLLHYVDGTKRYKPEKKATVVKERPIMYASHTDSAIFGWYSHKLNVILNDVYDTAGISESVIAYRALAMGNYDFSAEVLNFAQKLGSCSILAFDVTGFFDNLSHDRLKARLKYLLDVSELPSDWFNVYRAITKFTFVDMQDVKANPTLRKRLDDKSTKRIATVAELKGFGIPLRKNGQQFKPARDPNRAGIPQGTPISAALSNAYMLEFDRGMKSICDDIGAMYRRYSDDILVVCSSNNTKAIEEHVRDLLKLEGLTVSEKKTEITEFSAVETLPIRSRVAQYLGFSFHSTGAAIRPSSISRQARKIRQSVRRAKRSAENGNGVLHTRKLRKRFTFITDVNTKRPIRNFPSYAYRSAEAFGDGRKIKSQALKLQRMLEREIAKAKIELV